VTALRLLARAAPLAAIGAAGFLLGSCGGGESGLATATGPAATRPDVTVTRTAPTRTSETVTTVETETSVETETTVVPTRTTTVVIPPTTTATTTEPASSEDSTPWGWIALALALAAAVLVGLLLWRRRHTQAAAWSSRLTDLSRRSLLALDDVVAEGSLVTGRVEALAGEARSLEARAPDGPSRSDASALRLRLDDLATALEADRKLRLGSTAPSQEQLDYSTSLIHRQVAELQDVLRPADAGRSPD
jgi:MYXO-CTERM domain-containing protein